MQIFRTAKSKLQTTCLPFVVIFILNLSYTIFMVVVTRTSLCLVGHTCCSCYTKSSNNPAHPQFYEHNMLLLTKYIPFITYN